MEISTNLRNKHEMVTLTINYCFLLKDLFTLELYQAQPGLQVIIFYHGIGYTRGGQPVAHAPYVAHWLLRSGALHLFDNKPLLLTNFFFICPPPIFFCGKLNI